MASDAANCRLGQSLARAAGRGWATLDRPMAPGINQCIRSCGCVPWNQAVVIALPTYEGAANTLREIAVQDASKRLILNLRKAWSDKRQAASVPVLPPAHGR